MALTMDKRIVEARLSNVKAEPVFKKLYSYTD